MTKKLPLVVDRDMRLEEDSHVAMALKFESIYHRSKSTCHI